MKNDIKIVPVSVKKSDYKKLQFIAMCGDMGVGDLISEMIDSPMFRETISECFNACVETLGKEDKIDGMERH